MRLMKKSNENLQDDLKPDFKTGKNIKKLRNKLKNDYFSTLADNINVVGEARKIE